MGHRKVKIDKDTTRFYTKIYTFKYLRRLERMLKKSKKIKGVSKRRYVKLEDFIIKKAKAKYSNNVSSFSEIYEPISSVIKDYGIKPFVFKQNVSEIYQHYQNLA